MLKGSAFYYEKQKGLIPKKYNLGRSLLRVPTDGALLSQFSGKVLMQTSKVATKPKKYLIAPSSG